MFQSEVETIFNIFVYFNDGLADQYGICIYHRGGDDDFKLRFLAEKATEGFEDARRFSFGRKFTADEWQAAVRLGGYFKYFERAFSELSAPVSPLVVVTPIVNGKPRVDIKTSHDGFKGDDATRQAGLGVMPDYLVDYMRDGQFLFIELIHDDYFRAIRVLHNEGLYISCSKLLMSCIDTLAFIEFGDVRGNFSLWLDSFADLTHLSISSEELWEFRNSLLHMTNLRSRKVVAGKISPLIVCVGPSEHVPKWSGTGPKFLHLGQFIQIIGKGIERWSQTYTTDPSKMEKFIERYDLTVSDTRLARFRIEPQR